MKPHDKERIFERFYRVEDDSHREKGLGLGLAIVKEILSSHNAAVEVESQPYKGSQFIVTFPLLRA
jgi:signal transduction histidine kinase